MTDSVTIGHGSPTAVFRNAQRSDSDDPYAGSNFVIELRADGLNVERVVFMYTFSWASLVDFFDGLAAAWRGWDGERLWESPEYDLAISGVSDTLGHNMLQITVRDGPVYTWKTRVDGFSISAGEDMAAIARDLRSWVDSA